MGDGVWTKERQSNGVKRWALQPTPARPGFEDVVDMLAEIERAWGEIERLSEHLSIANTALEPIERDNERLTAEIERLRAVEAVRVSEIESVLSKHRAAFGVAPPPPPAARQSRVGELREQIASYDGGDRPMSPPVGLMRELREAEAKLVQPSATPPPLTEEIDRAALVTADAIDAWADRFSAAMSGAQEPDVTARLVGEARRWLDRCVADPLAVIDLAEAHVSRGRMLDMRTAPLTEEIDRAALVTWLRAIAVGEVDLTPDVESLLTALSAALDRQRRTAPLTEAEARAWAALAYPRILHAAHRPNVIAGLLLAASRGDIPADVRTGAIPPRGPTEATLRAALLVANNALVEIDVDDHEHQIECHANTLPLVYRRLALAAREALNALGPVVAEMVEPDIPDAVRVTCDVCEGRGWVKGSEVSQAVCGACGGTGKPTTDGATVTTTPGHVWRRDASGGSELVPAPVDVPHDLRLDKLSRFAGADAATADPKCSICGGRGIVIPGSNAWSPWPRYCECRKVTPEVKP